MSTSLFAKVKIAEHSTVVWLEKKLTQLEGEAPTIEKMADATLEYAGPALQIGLDAIDDPAAAAAVGVVVTEARTKLAAASALITDFGPTPTAVSIYDTVASNLSTVLATANVTNKTTVATVTKVVGEVGTLANAVSVAATAIKTAAAPAAPTTEPTTEPAAAASA